MVLGEEMALHKLEQNQREETEVLNSHFLSGFSIKANILTIDYDITTMVGTRGPK